MNPVHIDLHVRNRTGKGGSDVVGDGVSEHQAATDAERSKQAGDRLYQDGKYAEAVDKYTIALRAEDFGVCCVVFFVLCVCV